MSLVLIPKEMEGVSSLPEGVEAIYYTHKHPSLFERVKHKALKPRANVFKYKIILEKSENLKDVKALWLSSGMVLSQQETEQLLEQLVSLQWVYSQCTGSDHLALITYRDKGVKVSTTGDLVSAWVAQMNLACILAHSKRLPTHIIKQRNFCNGPVSCEDIEDQHVAILGTGNVGNRTASLCSALGMSVMGISKRPHEIVINTSGYDVVCDVADIDTVLSDIDYLILTLPLTAHTKGFIDKEKLSRLKRSACLINLARPQIVDEKALLSTLKNDGIEAAYVSGLQNVSRLERFLANRLSNLVITHYSDANLKKKKLIAYRQFTKGLMDLAENREVES